MGIQNIKKKMGFQSKYYHFVSVEQFGDCPRNQNLQKNTEKKRR